MGTATIKPHALPKKPIKDAKTRAKGPCRCLGCANSTRETYDGKEILICRDEACYLKCEECIVRPNFSCGYKALPNVDVEIREEVQV